MRQGKSNPRWLRRVGVYALIGLLLSVAVSWGLAALLPAHRLFGFTQFQDSMRTANPAQAAGYVSVSRMQGLGAIRRSFTVMPRDLGASRHRLNHLQGARFTRAEPIVSIWNWPGNLSGDWGRLPLTIRGLDTGLTLNELHGIEDARGFPALCLWHGIASTGVPVEVSGAIKLPPFGTPETATTVRALPLRPIWTGLAVNTSFYGLLVFGLVSLVNGARRYRRLKRGRCPACGYDLGFDLRGGCPECGWRRGAPAA